MKNWEIRLVGLNQNMTQAKNIAGMDPSVYLSLSERPDPSWIKIFEEELAKQPRPINKWSGSARVEGPNVVFTCPLAEESIQGWIEALKPAIERTNHGRAKLGREQAEEERQKAAAASEDALGKLARKLRF